MGLDWTAIIVALVGSGGVVYVIVDRALGKGRSGASKAAEDRAVERVSAPAVGGTTSSHNLEAIKLAQQAMNQVTSFSEKLRATEDRLGQVERELGMFRRSYHALYWWAQRLIWDWDSLSEEPQPPALPEGIHHPEA